MVNVISIHFLISSFSSEINLSAAKTKYIWIHSANVKPCYNLINGCQHHERSCLDSFLIGTKKSLISFRFSNKRWHVKCYIKDGKMSSHTTLIHRTTWNRNFCLKRSSNVLSWPTVLIKFLWRCIYVLWWNLLYTEEYNSDFNDINDHEKWNVLTCTAWPNQ